ncbi:NAD(P)/FAD-dependent oxidoreductase, partial [Methylobacterium gnaphalii]|uniref:NAD(P)/FAD-dependent oxidoreductase n=1 Tax=Methylobacterium gnaphalii TaxID=1010610 RepID=UPI0024B54248
FRKRRPVVRPPLSKHVLAGDLRAEATELPQLTAVRAQWRLGQAAVALDRAGRTIRLADDTVLPYRSLLVTTGARARPFPGAGAGLPGVHTIRGRDDAAALRSALAEKPRRVLIVGGGLIGCEAASCCRDLGLSVTLVDPNPTPLARVLGMLVGNSVAVRMKDAGVSFRPHTHVKAFESRNGKVARARLEDGGEIEADLVIVALGAERDARWLAKAGLLADGGGLTCDAACRAMTGEGAPDPHIYAAGDIARWPNPLFGDRLRTVEHWGNAVEQARHAARNMLAGRDDQKAYAHLPAFWSSQFDVNIKAIGSTEGADKIAIVHGSRTSGRFLAVYGRAGRTVAAVSFDEARWLPAYESQIACGAPFPPILDATDQAPIDHFSPGFPAPRLASESADTTERESIHA